MADKCPHGFSDSEGMGCPYCNEADELRAALAKAEAERDFFKEKIERHAETALTYQRERDAAVRKIEQFRDWNERVKRDAEHPDQRRPERTTLWGVYWAVRGILNGGDDG